MCLIQEHKSHDAVSIELCTVVVRCVPGYKHINMIWTGPGIHPRKEGRKEGGVLLFVCSYAHRSVESGTLFPTLKPSISTYTHVFCVRSPYQIFEEDHSVLPSDHTGHTITNDSFWSLSCLSPARGGRTKT